MHTTTHDTTTLADNMTVEDAAVLRYIHQALGEQPRGIHDEPACLHNGANATYPVGRTASTNQIYTYLH
uniref:GST N-terminal domain-containing protein n=1 Tax=Ascaris lumbricoides TaxID=6252 RepID=A0A0M3I7D3_ASCLU